MKGRISMNDFNQFYCTELTNLKMSQMYMSQMLDVVVQNNYRLSAELEASNHALYMQKTQFPRTLEHDISSGHYYIKERNGRIIPIGIIKIKEVIIINPHNNDTFDFVYVEYNTCETETYSTTIPYKDFVAKRLLQHFYKFQKHIDCPDKILRDVFYFLIMDSANQKALTIPAHIGWMLSDIDTGHYITGNNYNGIAYINCIPEYILNYRINPTTRKPKEVLKDYLRLAPQNWKTTFLLGFRITCLILSLYAPYQLELSQALAVETNNSQETAFAIAMLKTFNRFSNTTLALNSAKSKISQELAETNDGICVFHDTFLIENEKKILDSLTPIVNDLQHAADSKEHSRHGIAIISKFVSHLFPSELICTLNLDGIQYNGSASELMRISEEMDFIIIQIIENNMKEARSLIENMLEIQNKYLSQIFTDNVKNTCLLIKASLMLAGLIFNYKFLDKEAEINIVNLMRQNNDSEFNSSQIIADDFSDVVNNLIRNDEFNLVRKESDTVFTSCSNTVMVMNGNLEFEPVIIYKKILPLMNTTHNRDKLINALTECSYLYATNKNRHPVSVYDENGKAQLIHTYSISCNILDHDNRYKVDNLANQEYLLKKAEIPESDFLPLLSLPVGETAGRQECFSNNENNHIYITGQSGFGKSFLLSQIVYNSALIGQKVIIFDSSDSFNPEAVSNNISPEFLKNHVTFHSLEEDGIPVDLFNLDGSMTLPQRKNLLAGILSAAASDLSAVQFRTLKTVLSNILSITDSGDQIRPEDILAFFDENDNTQKSLINRFYSIFEDIESCSMSDKTWRQFIEDSKDVIIISTQSAFTQNGNQLIDMLLATLYNYQLQGTDYQLDIFIDEMQNQNISDGSPIWKILREGRKYHIAFIGATQKYFQKGDPVGKVMNNAETLIFLKPTTDSEKDAATVLGFKKNEINKFHKMNRGDCIISGKFYSKRFGCNRPAVLSGKVYSNR